MPPNCMFECMFMQDKCGCLPKRPNPRSQLYLLWGLPTNFADFHSGKRELHFFLVSWSLTLHSCFILIYGIINTSICRKILGDFRFFKGCWWNMTTNEQSKHKSSAIRFFGFGCQDEEICQEWNPSLVNHNLTFCEFPWAYVILVILVLLPWENSPSLQETFFRRFKVTFCCPPVGGHLNSLWKGHLTIRKKVEKNCQVFTIFTIFQPCQTNLRIQCLVFQVALPV